ncbi:S1 family peptidase [Crossiella sp. CA-258035]|uniref:S1 family peptidase n=1 Tax=Crossiella sp. CA-258035 TaxID=2981138 RepID=UPI0024BC4BD2|nr:S1 family peptidase [Crossiella sp. CA-258035]WHT16506.1 S1 family peptidase [Crossiella sp. CA-258035]
MSDRVWRSLRAGVTVTIAATAVLAGPSAAAAPELDGATAAAVDHLVAGGLDRDTAVRRITTQDSLSRTAQRLTAELGARAGGAFLEAGSLVVAVTDDAAAKVAEAAGAKAKRVVNGAAELASAKQAVRKLLAGVRGSTSHTDVVNNTVVATIPAGAAHDAVAAQADAINGVQVRRSAGKASKQANLYGGQQIEFSVGGGNYVCSVGFTATDRDRRPVMITAGHCADGINDGEFRRNGAYLGTVRAHSFPTNDYAYSSLSADWTAQASVTKYNGTAVRVTGHGVAAPGSTICKSGRTTNWTCGEVESLDVTINYDDGTTVEEMTQASVCTEGGDSGGSWMAGNTAQGVTSGGIGYFIKDTNGDGRIDNKDKAFCGEKAGEPNVAYFQPIGEVLNAYGLTLKTS